MDNYLLSIVVPTKNRYQYLYYLIKQVFSIGDSSIELVIQDNSENNEEFCKYLEKHSYNFISYYWESKPLTVSENSDLAVLHAKGQYVVFVGDDDVISRYLIKFVAKMDSLNIEGAIFNKANFDWPGVKRYATRITNVTIPAFRGKVRTLNPSNERARILNRCGVSLNFLPSLYQGVIKKSVLEKLRDDCGTFFPGSSPDMAIAIALSYYIKNYVYCDLPLISSGASPKSAAGLGAKHQHKGSLKDMSFLPYDIEKTWEKRIPMIWTAETIYADSIFQALKRIGQQSELAKFNFNFFYAQFRMFERDYKGMLKNPNIEGTYSKVKTNLYYIELLVLRIYLFIINRTIKRTRFSGNKYICDINDSFQAMAVIDKEISSKMNIFS